MSDIYVRHYGDEWHGPVAPAPPKRVCHRIGHINDEWACTRCNDYRKRVAEWMKYARTADWCGKVKCEACHPTNGYSTTSAGREQLERVHAAWLRLAPTWEQPHVVCQNCDESWHYCSCQLCGDCGELTQESDCCASCGKHKACGGCECVQCERGGHATTLELCDICNSCDNCCNCTACAACAIRRPYCDSEGAPNHCVHRYCRPCRQTEDGCPVCSDSQYFDPTGIQWGSTVTDLRHYKHNPIRRLMGVELECYARKWPKAAKAARKWGAGIVHDGSIIRPVGHDIEITSAPAQGEHFITQVRELTEALKADGAGVNTSCGTHVHIDASSYKWWDVQKLIKLYAKVEDELFDILAPYRRISSYSKPCGQKFLRDFVVGLKSPKALKSKLLRGIYNLDIENPHNKHNRRMAENVRSAYRHKYNSHRYNALNIHSWFRRGTIEFRHYHGTLTAENIINWALLCGNIVTQAERMSDKEIESLSSREALNYMFLSAEHEEWFASRLKYMATMNTPAALDEQENVLCDNCDRPRFTQDPNENDYDHECDEQRESCDCGSEDCSECNP